MQNGLFTDGVSGYVDFGDNLHVDQDVFSISCWLMRGPSGVSAWFFPFASGDNGSGVTVAAEPAAIDLGLQDVLDQNFAQPLSQWTPCHVVLVQQFSGGAPSNALLYFNGVLSSDSPMTTAPNVYTDSSGSNAGIGKLVNTSGPFFGNGAVAELCVWTRDVSANVATLYNGGVILPGTEGSGPWATGLAGGYHCDEASGTTLHDFSGNGVDGTLSGGASFAPFVPELTYGAGNPFDSGVFA